MTKKTKLLQEGKLANIDMASGAEPRSSLVARLYCGADWRLDVGEKPDIYLDRQPFVSAHSSDSNRTKHFRKGKNVDASPEH